MSRWLLALTALFALALSACHTAEGFGKDLRILGDKISGKAKEKQ